MQRLFASCCRPLCSQETPGAYRFGRRLVAIDGSRQDVADTQANAAAFQRPSNQYGPGPFPQIRLLLLSECGSHASFGACVASSQQAKVTIAPFRKSACSCSVSVAAMPVLEPALPAASKLR